DVAGTQHAHRIGLHLDAGEAGALGEGDEPLLLVPPLVEPLGGADPHVAAAVDAHGLDGVAQQPFGHREALFLLAVPQHADTLALGAHPDTAIAILCETRYPEGAAQIDGRRLAIVDARDAIHGAAHP